MTADPFVESLDEADDGTRPAKAPRKRSRAERFKRAHRLMDRGATLPDVAEHVPLNYDEAVEFMVERLAAQAS